MKARHQGWRRIVISLAAFAASSAWIAPAIAAGYSGKPLYFEISEGPAQSQLTEFSKQSELQMIYDYEAFGGVMTRAVRGNYKPLDALGEMVKGTDIKFALLEGNRTVTIRRGTYAAKDAKSEQPAAANRLYRNARDRRTPDSTIEEQVTIRADAAATTSLPAIGSPRFSLARPDIEAGGFVTVPSVIRTLPQIFGGGPYEDTWSGTEARTNSARGSGINLRGLGAGSTLVLMNGRRLPAGGSEGIFVDVSNLPLAAVERIDLLPDNASTFYGSDAAAGVVNFVMRDKFDGAQTEGYFSAVTKGHVSENYVSQIVGGHTDTARGLITFDFHSRDSLPASSRTQATSDLTPWGGTNFDVPVETIISGSSTWAIPRLPDGRQPGLGDLELGTQNLQDRMEGVDVLPSQQRWTMFATGQKKLGDTFTFFVDALYGQRNARSAGGQGASPVSVPSSNPFVLNPSGLPLPVSVAYSFLDELGGLDNDVRVTTQDYALVLDWHPGNDWNVRSTLSHASEAIHLTVKNTIDRDALGAALRDPNPQTALNLFGGPNNPATIASLRAESALESASTIRSADIRASGSIAQWKAGDVALSFGGEQREQLLKRTLVEGRRSPGLLEDRAGRTIRSAFAELTLPLVGDRNGVSGLRRLELSLAERYESFSDFGSIQTSRFGLAWKPSPTLTLRGSYSESFRPPGLMDLMETGNGYAYVPLPHPDTGAPTMTLLWGGKNRDLQAARARSWTTGFELASGSLPGAALAMTYFDIRLRGRIGEPPVITVNPLTDPLFAQRVQWNPSDEYRAEVCARAPQAGNASRTPCIGVPVAAVIDLRPRNDAITETRGLDLLAKYERDTYLGRLSLALNGTYILEFSEAKAAWQPTVNVVSTPNNPLNLRLRTMARWERGPINVAGAVNYANSYLDTVSVPRRHVTSWTTVDLRAAYQLGDGAPGPFGDMRLSLGMENLLDERPPFLNNSAGIGYDPENADLMGRVISVNVQKKW